MTEVMATRAGGPIWGRRGPLLALDLARLGGPPGASAGDWPRVHFDRIDEGALHLAVDRRNPIACAPRWGSG
jgi:hypothetical protein